MCPPENIKNNSDTDDLIKEGKTKEDLANGPVDDFLKRWANKNFKKEQDIQKKLKILEMI